MLVIYLYIILNFSSGQTSATATCCLVPQSVLIEFALLFEMQIPDLCEPLGNNLKHHDVHNEPEASVLRDFISILYCT